MHLHSLIRVFDGPSMGIQRSNFSSGGKLRLLSDCLDAQTNLNLCYSHMPTCTLCWIPTQIRSTSLNCLEYKLVLPSQHDWKYVDWDIQNQTKKNKQTCFICLKYSDTHWSMRSPVPGHSFLTKNGFKALSNISGVLIIRMASVSYSYGSMNFSLTWALYQPI